MEFQIEDGYVFTTFPKDIKILTDDNTKSPGGYIGIGFQEVGADAEGVRDLVIFMSGPQLEQLKDAIGPTHPSGRGGNRLDNFIDESRCHKVQVRSRQLKDQEKDTRSNARSYNFKKWFAGERALPGLWTKYYTDYLPGHERGHQLTDACRIAPPIP